MSELFEDPRKTEMRARAEIAIDAAGYELVAEPVTYALGGGLNGSLKGDLQSLDGNEVRYAYYLRPDPRKAVPQWLVNLARAAGDHGEVRMFLVVTERHGTLERSCRSARVGLLLLTADNTFDMLVDPDENAAEEQAAEISRKAREARRRMETKLQLNTRSIGDNYAKVNEITTGMPTELRDKYIDNVEHSATLWDEWGQRVSTMLDEAAANGDEVILTAAERLIEQGAQ